LRKSSGSFIGFKNKAGIQEKLRMGKILIGKSVNFIQLIGNKKYLVDKPLESPECRLED